VPARDLGRLLWDLLNTRDFRRAMRNRNAWETNRVLDFGRDLGYAEGDEPYVVPHRLQELQLLISQLGYTVTLQPSPRTGFAQYVDLRIEKGTGAKAAKRHLAGGFQYKPGQGVSALGQAQIAQLSVPLRNSTLSAQGGGPSGDLWSGSYFTDFLVFEALHERASARLNASSVTDRERFLAGEKVDEHRTGGLGELEWQPFRDLGGALLLLHLDANHSVVSLGAAHPQQLNSLQLGAVLVHREDVRFEPRILLGRDFARATATSNLHHRFDRWEYDISSRFENATRATPLFELPSFGGEDTVRGFRADDAVGQRLWSLQSELWRPIPGLENWAPSSAQIQAFVQKLRIAPFFDLGGAYQTIASRPGLREGAGLGLRLDLRLAVLKLDWAYGLGDAATGGSRGKFYFSIGLNVPY